jgi:hypothetical protein
MSAGRVYVIDRMVAKPGCARMLVDIYLSEYVAGARERGMTLGDVLVSPPIWSDDLPSPQAWWQMTWRGRPDPTLGEWWSRIDELVVERTRSFAAAADDVDGLCDV